MTKENSTVSKIETTTLTEQWQQGKLEDGFYFVKEDDEIFISICSNHYLLNVIKDCEVIAPVSYDQFSQLVKKVDELVTKCHRLENLLKRCRDSVEFDGREALGGGADYQAKILSSLLKEIDEVLKCQ